ncbi:MAG: 50S ribosomal protein L29 [Nitrospinota bacterium]
MKADKLRDFSEEELMSRLSDLKKEYMKLRFRHATSQLESPMEIRKIRRTIARGLTILTSKRAGKEEVS